MVDFKTKVSYQHYHYKFTDFNWQLHSIGMQSMKQLRPLKTFFNINPTVMEQ